MLCLHHSNLVPACQHHQSTCQGSIQTCIQANHLESANLCRMNALDCFFVHLQHICHVISCLAYMLLSYHAHQADHVCSKLSCIQTMHAGLWVKTRNSVLFSDTWSLNMRHPHLPQRQDCQHARTHAHTHLAYAETIATIKLRPCLLLLHRHLAVPNS